MTHRTSGRSPECYLHLVGGLAVDGQLDCDRSASGKLTGQKDVHLIESDELVLRTGVLDTRVRAAYHSPDTGYGRAVAEARAE